MAPHLSSTVRGASGEVLGAARRRPVTLIATVDGIRCTTPVRTPVDLAPELERSEFERVVHDTLDRRLFTVEEDVIVPTPEVSTSAEYLGVGMGSAARAGHSRRGSGHPMVVREVPMLGAEPGDEAWRHTVRAVNHATDSQNRIHADDVAAQLGFRGGLVPGVDVFAYLTVPPLQAWGAEWLADGRLDARFVAPVYDGDLVTVRAIAADADSAQLELVNAAGERCATATAQRVAAAEAPDPEAWPVGRQDSAGAPASSTSLAVGTALVPLEFGFHADKAAGYLAEVNEPSSVYEQERIAHPGWLLRFANLVLANHVRLGPWIHVESDVTFLGLVRDGARVEVRAVVTDEYERKGHRFVVLDVLTTADGSPVQRTTHTAIHTLRGHEPPRT